jgi:hypothetical protein
MNDGYFFAALDLDDFSVLIQKYFSASKTFTFQAVMFHISVLKVIINHEIQYE